LESSLPRLARLVPLANSSHGCLRSVMITPLLDSYRRTHGSPWTDNPAAGATDGDLDGWAAAGGHRRPVPGREPAVPGQCGVGGARVSFVWYGVGCTSGLINVATLIAFYRLGTALEAVRQHPDRVVGVRHHVGDEAGRGVGLPSSPPRARRLDRAQGAVQQDEWWAMAVHLVVQGQAVDRRVAGHVTQRQVPLPAGS
jgi:hypothetical protein